MVRATAPLAPPTLRFFLGEMEGRAFVFLLLLPQRFVFFFRALEPTGFYLRFFLGLGARGARLPIVFVSSFARARPIPFSTDEMVVLALLTLLAFGGDATLSTPMPR